MSFKRYMNKEQAKRAQAKVSLFAALNGKCSQTEVREVSSGFYVGGYPGDLAANFPNARIVAQYSQGYFCR